MLQLEGDIDLLGIDLKDKRRTAARGGRLRAVACKAGSLELHQYSITDDTEDVLDGTQIGIQVSTIYIAFQCPIACLSDRRRSSAAATSRKRA